MNGGVGERGRYRRGEMGPGHGDRDGIELDPVDPRRTMSEELPDHPVDPPAEEEDAARIGVLQGGQVDEGFRLRPSGFEGEGVVLEHGDLSGEARYGYPRIRRIAGRQEPLVVPGRHRPVDGRPVPQEDAHRCRDAPGDAAPPPGPLVPKEEQGRCRGDQGAGDGQRKILNPQPEGGGGQGAPDQGARTFNPVGSGQCPAFRRVKPGGGAKQEPRDQPDRRERDDERRQLQGKGEVGAGDAAQGHAAGPEEDDAEGKAEGEGDKEVRRPAAGWKKPSFDRRASPGRSGEAMPPGQSGRSARSRRRRR